MIPGLLFFELVVVAAVMVGAYVWLIRVFSSTVNLLYLLLVYLVEVMMLVMFVSVTFYVLSPSPEALAAVVGANMFVMVAGLVYVLGNAESIAERRLTGGSAILTFSILLVANEGAMGYLFSLVSPMPTFSIDTILGALYAIGGTYWFVIPVALELLYTVRIGKNPRGPRYLPVVPFFVSPALLGDTYWKAFSTGVSVLVASYIAYRLRTDVRSATVYASFVIMLLGSFFLPVLISPAYLFLAYFLLYKKISEVKGTPH